MELLENIVQLDATETESLDERDSRSVGRISIQMAALRSDFNSKRLLQSW